MEFYRDETGSLTKLAKQNVDTGMGLERMCKVLQGKETVYDTDIFAPLIAFVEQETGKSYADNQKNIRILVDHFRAAAQLIDQGLTPSNIGP